MSTTSSTLEGLKISARDLLRAFRADDPLARKRVAAHIPGLARSGTDFRLAGAQFVVAREHGYGSWPRLKATIEAGEVPAAGCFRGPSTMWRRAVLQDAARRAAARAENRDVEGLLQALALLGRRNGDAVQQMLDESGAYSAVVETLIAGTERPEPRLRFECAHLMDHFADERCIEPLRRLLDDPVPRVRRVALHSLSCDACKPAPLGARIDFVSLAAERALEDSSMQVRRHAARELAARRSDPRAAAALRRLLAGTDDRALQRIARRALERVSESNTCGENSL